MGECNCSQEKEDTRNCAETFIDGECTNEEECKQGGSLVFEYCSKCSKHPDFCNNECQKKEYNMEQFDNLVIKEHPVKELCNSLADLIIEKNKAYGNSVVSSTVIMKELYPDGIPVDQYQNALMIVRTIDKLKRIATNKDAFGESPWKDIAGYSILAQVNDKKS